MIRGGSVGWRSAPGTMSREGLAGGSFGSGTMDSSETVGRAVDARSE
jgi:hypothetical protein